MAQARVTEYFGVRKRQSEFHASKRRKVIPTETSEESLTLDKSDGNSVKTVVTRSSGRISTPAGVKATSKQKQQTASTRSKSSRTKSKAVQSKSLKDCVQSATSSLDSIKEGKKGDATNSVIVSADVVVSAVCDDHHGSPPCSPIKAKPKKPTEEADIDDKTSKPVTRKRSKPKNSAPEDLLQSQESNDQKGYDFSEYVKTNAKDTAPVSRRRLILKNTVKSSGSGSAAGNTQSEVKQEDSRVDTEQTVTHSSETDSSSANSSENNTDGKQINTAGKEKSIQPVKDEPSRCKEFSNEQTCNSKESHTNAEQTDTQERKQIKSESDAGHQTKTPTEETQTLLEKNVPGKVDFEKMKLKLKKCGKLSELQEQLTKFNKAADKVKEKQKTTEEKKEVESQEKAPAYERFHSLAVSVPPTLSLPFKYKVVFEMFRSMETVVSMLHNRSELCTFSKLKKAVQTMIHRNFELKNVGQIKTVHPKAYLLRQEKGLPSFDGKNNSYQLTIEPLLVDSASKSDSSNGRIQFTVNHLLERRAFFQRCLIDIVKKHHKDFLANLQRPLSIPDDKITRWHPRFALDEVPDIECAELPTAPDVQTFTSAKDVLNHTRGKLPQRIQKALENVSKDSKVETAHPTSTVKSPPKKDEGNSKPSASGNSLQGVSQSLLEKIRAKEAKKLEEKMMLKPQDDKRSLMMGRMIEFTRILRTIFVQEKKPALPVDYALKKLGDSCRSAMSSADLEGHLKLMQEILPDWVSTVNVRQGKFLKIDRNKDLTVIHEKINKLIKQLP